MVSTGAGGRNRTDMELPPEDFESFSAATCQPAKALNFRKALRFWALFQCDVGSSTWELQSGGQKKGHRSGEGDMKRVVEGV